MEPGTSRRPANSGPPLFAPSRLNLKTVFTACTGVAIFGAGLYILWHAKVALLLMALGLLLAVGLDHGVRWLQGRGASRRLAVASILLALVAALAGLGLLVVPAVADQAEELAREGPRLLSDLRSSRPYRALGGYVDLDHIVDASARGVRDHPAEVTATALSIASLLFGAAAGAMAVLAMAGFMLIYGPDLVRWVLDRSLAAHQGHLRRAVGRIHRALGGYVAGAVALVLVNAASAAVFLAILGVPYFLPLAVVSGLGSLVPILGVTVAGVAMIAMTAISHGVWLSLVVAGYVLLYQQLENQLLEPMVFSRAVALNPLLVLVSVLVLGELAGIAGAVLAVPLLAAGKIVANELLSVRAEQLDLPREPDR